MTSPTRTALLLVFILGLTARPGGAQARFEIGGVVTDETGGLIAGASVTLKDERGGVQASTSTNQNGRYRLVAANSGKSTMTVSKAGFAPASRTVTVASTGTATIDVRLRVAITERVDVHSGLARASLASDQNLSGIRLSGKMLEALPDDPESLLQTLRLLAATTGTRLDLVTFYVDGMPLIKLLPPKDVIQSVRINANPFSAEFAEPGASRVEILTKPASQHFHGNGRVDFNDARMNARNVFEPAGARYQTRTYEGYIGGPVVPNHWGFLAYGGRWGQDDNVVVNATPIDPVTLETQELHLNVAAPTRTTSYVLRSDARLRNHIVGVEFGENKQTRRNAGLQSGFDLPERAYSGDAKEQTTSLWVTSTFRAAVNEFRARATHTQMIDQAVTTTPAIMVLEAFNAGGNQEALFRESKTDRVQLTNVFTYGTGAHSIRAGGQVEVVRLEQVDRANFNGTFVFGSDLIRDQFGNPVPSAAGEPTTISGPDLYQLTLAGTPGYRPSQFSIAGGDPAVKFSVVEGAEFAQDDWRVAPRVTLSYGVRHEHQEQGGALHMKLAPRATLAWAPSANGDSAVRGGVGLFYTRIPEALFSDVLRLDGRHGQRLVVYRPAFFPGVPDTLPGAQNVTATIRTQAPDLTLPSMLVSTISYDRRLAGQLFGSIGYTWRRGANLLRTRNIGVPAGAGAPGDALILQFESTGRSSAHDINATVSGNIGPNVTVFGSYGWTRALQDTDDLYSVPADSSNLAAEWGVAAVPRHRASFGGSFNLADENFAIYPFVTWTSELPFNITTGGDINHDSVFTDRPALADAGQAGAVATPFGVFNLTPTPGEAVIPRNFGVGPTQFTFDVTGAKTFVFYNGLVPTSRRLTVLLSVTNLLNHTNYAPFNGVLNSPFFGTANRALDKRRVTIGLRYDF